MSVDMMIGWLVIFILAILVEILSLGLTSIWFAGGALAAIVATLFHANAIVQIVVFVVVTLFLLAFTRPLAVKYFNKDRIKTNAESLIGKQAIVLADIDNLQEKGQVTVNGQEWTARGTQDEKVILQGTVVEIVAISGVKLIVKEMV